MPLPPGVTLRQIDGGPAYYADNGFTYASTVDATMAAAGAKSWDDPSWFPVGCWWSFPIGTSIPVFRQLGLNFNNVGGTYNAAATLHANGIWNIDNQPSNTNYGNETIGFHVEEPDGWNTNPGGNPDVIDQCNSSPFPLTGRFIQTAFTAGQMGFNTLAATPSNVNMQYVMATSFSTPWGSRHLDIAGGDKYWFASQNITSSLNDGRVIEMGSGVAVADQMARGSNYGDLVDLYRSWYTTYPAPIWSPYIENDDGLLGPGPGGANIGGVPVTPPQMNWAAWSSLVHGARAIIYFGAPSDNGWGSTFGFGTTVQAGQNVSIFTQACNTNALVQNLAPVLNSPFAVGYVTASPAAYNFPTPLVSVNTGRNGWGVTGIDVMAKYYTAGTYANPAGTFGAGFYIFAHYRGSQTAANIAATFTTADSYTGPVLAINADGGGTSYGTPYALNAVNGVFTDTFTSGSSVRIYRVTPSLIAAGHPAAMTARRSR